MTRARFAQGWSGSLRFVTSNQQARVPYCSPNESASGVAFPPRLPSEFYQAPNYVQSIALPGVRRSSSFARVHQIIPEDNLSLRF